MAHCSICTPADWSKNSLTRHSHPRWIGSQQSHQEYGAWTCGNDKTSTCAPTKADQMIMMTMRVKMIMMPMSMLMGMRMTVWSLRTTVDRHVMYRLLFRVLVMVFASERHLDANRGKFFGPWLNLIRFQLFRRTAKNQNSPVKNKNSNTFITSMIAVNTKRDSHTREMYSRRIYMQYANKREDVLEVMR